MSDHTHVTRGPVHSACGPDPGRSSTDSVLDTAPAGAHPRQPERAVPDTNRKARDLMSGPWLVQTRGSTPVWGLDAMTYTRRRGPDGVSRSMTFDGHAVPITRVEARPEVSESFVVWCDNPDPDLVQLYRSPSTIRSIRPLSRPVKAAQEADVS